MTEPIRKLGRYELLRRIAKGGMGEIYLAKVRGTGGFEKPIIIKTILDHLAEEQEFIEKFLDEGRIVMQLVHGNIVPVFDMAEEDGEYFIAMEYIPGRDLREVMKRLQADKTFMPMDLALYVASEVCKGLHYAHRKTSEDGDSLRIVHRDVSPSNVLISSEGEVKLIDFGIARAAGKLSKTISGRIQGKFCYMSPEQASGKKLDGRSDIFSLGVTLYEMLTGFRPFEGESDLESLELVRTCDFDPPSTLNPAIPEEIDQLVGRALTKNMDERYASADKMQIALLQYLYSTGTSPTGEELAQFLDGLFPSGLEREELRDARGSKNRKKKKDKKFSLDEALDFELDQMLHGETGEHAADESIDPLRTTAISGSDQLGPTTSTADLRPTEEDDVAPSPTHETDAPPSTSVTDVRDTNSSPWPKIAVVVVVLLIAGAVYANSATKPAKGRIDINSSPPGASILIDGAAVVGAKTPHVLERAPGAYKITLELDGHQPRTFAVEVEPEATFNLAADDAKLAVVGGPKSRTITITSVPSDAVLLADGVQFGTGAGAPLTIEPDQSIKVTTRHSECNTLNYLVSHAHPKDALVLELDCPTPTPDAGPAEEPHVVKTSAMVDLTVKSSPPGAKISIGDRQLGPAPVRTKLRASETVDFRAELLGYEPVVVRRRVGTIRRGSLTLKLGSAQMGCIDLRLVSPGVGEIAIDGTWLNGNRGYLKKHRVPAGPHKVRVRNKKASKDDVFDVEVKPGSTCYYLRVWDS